MTQKAKPFAFRGLMGWFEAISSIPRASYHEKKIADFLVEFAKERALFCLRDESNNVFIRLPASPGCEGEAPILLQGHTDMVCEKRPQVTHDFSRDPLKLYEEDGWLYAIGTTLGADNGVAVAVMLYLLNGAEGHLGKHPTIECLFTASEEVGLDGAKAFDYSAVTARRMINMDSADEKLVIAGCAGGLRTDLTLNGEAVPAKGRAYRVCVGGLAGGHSGEDIDRGRANANLLLGRILYGLSEKASFRLVTVNGGNKDNAIPRDAEAVLVSDSDVSLADAAAALWETVKGELVAEDGDARLTVEEVALPVNTMSEELSQKVILLLSCVPNAIFERCEGLREMVEFSRNLGVVKTSEACTEVTFVFASRSAKDTQLDWSASQLDAFAKLLGGKTCHHSRYPGWAYDGQSALRTKYCDIYEEMYGIRPDVTVIHAGLECGIIKEKLPDMDIISCGPIVENLHSPDERMHMESFEKFFRVICRMVSAES